MGSAGQKSLIFCSHVLIIVFLLNLNLNPFLFFSRFANRIENTLQFDTVSNAWSVFALLAVYKIDKRLFLFNEEFLWYIDGVKPVCFNINLADTNTQNLGIIKVERNNTPCRINIKFNGVYIADSAACNHKVCKLF